MARKKHVPQRTCVGCRQVLAKRALIRVVRTPQGVQIDPTGKLAGRGAYIHDRRSCWERALAGSLAHALKAGTDNPIELSTEERLALLAFMSTLDSGYSQPDGDNT